MQVSPCPHHHLSAPLDRVSGPVVRECLTCSALVADTTEPPVSPLVERLIACAMAYSGQPDVAASIAKNVACYDDIGHPLPMADLTEAIRDCLRRHLQMGGAVSDVEMCALALTRIMLRHRAARQPLVTLYETPSGAFKRAGELHPHEVIALSSEQLGEWEREMRMRVVTGRQGAAFVGVRQ